MGGPVPPVGNRSELWQPDANSDRQRTMARSCSYSPRTLFLAAGILAALMAVTACGDEFTSCAARRACAGGGEGGSSGGGTQGRGGYAGTGDDAAGAAPLAGGTNPGPGGAPAVDEGGAGGNLSPAGGAGGDGSSSGGLGSGAGGTATAGSAPFGGQIGAGGSSAGAASGGTLSVGGTPASAGGVSGGTVPTGGVSGGAVSMGGAIGAGGATGNAHRFVGGPCVVVRDAHGTGLIYARGNDGHLYVYQHALSTSAGAISVPWRQLTGVDASIVADGSDLDCDGYPVTHLVATGTTPKNSVMHASGTDNAFSNFYATGVYVQQTPQNENSPSVKDDGGADSFAIVGTNAPTAAGTTSFSVYSIASGSVKTNGPSLTKSLVSATDTSGVAQVAYASDGSLLTIDQWYNMGFTGWQHEDYVAPPAGTAFQFSPTVCRGAVFVTAGNRLWRLTSERTWVKVSDVAVASAPDCTGDWLVAVATTNGSILYAYHSAGSTGPAAEAAIDLGVW